MFSNPGTTTVTRRVLLSTVNDLHVREEVHGCLESMLLDLETTHHLQQQLELESTKSLLEQAQIAQQGVILEAYAERLERCDRKIELADTFVVELLKANQELEELLAWKEAHEHKIQNYDALLSKLAETQDQLEEARRLPPTQDKEQASEDIIDTDTGSADEKEPLEKESHPQESTPESEASTPEPPEEDDQKPPASEPAVVSIDVDSSENIPTLMTLDVEPLMMVFGFLDAMDILNTAQINVTMYHKVDNIFGISEDGQSPPAPEPAVEKPPTAAAPQKPPPKSSESSGLFSMLQPAKPEAPKPKSQPLNAKVAQSMASKLSDAELAAIITMTDKLSKLEKEVHILRSEKEMIASKLDGTEAVKQFLIGKVRDVEVKLNRSKEDEIKVTQQIASDQEVIAFLDSRVQELEQMTEDLTLEKTGTQAGLDDLKVSTAKKITMLSDMLQYEREKVREDESDWKATKKVLVKEVKSCRAQILALQAERDGLQEQNDVLKRAIVSNGSSGSSPNHRRGRKNT